MSIKKVAPAAPFIMLYYTSHFDFHDFPKPKAFLSKSKAISDDDDGDIGEHILLLYKNWINFCGNFLRLSINSIYECSGAHNMLNILWL